MPKKSKQQWIDISVPIGHGMLAWPSDPPVEISPFKVIGKDKHSNVALLKMGTHTGTHIDAPRHSLIGGQTIDELDPDLMIGPVEVIEINDPVAIRAKELQGKGIKKGQRVIFKTRNSLTQWWKKDFQNNFIYLALDAAEFLAKRQVKLVGIDYLSVGGYKQENGLAVHKILLGAGVCITEGLALNKIKKGSYEMVCLPIKIFQGDGAPARVLLRA